ncbi:calcium-binding protein [Streptomyces sp. NPDC002643]
MRKYRTIAAAATAALALGGALFAAPAAQAADPGPATLVHDGELWYKAAPGQTNDLTISAEVEQRGEWEWVYVLTFDDRYEMTIESSAASADECVYPSASDHTVVQCAVEIPQNSDDTDIYDVTVRDGNDKVTIPADNSAYATIYGGPGNDVLDSASGAPVLKGEDGNDRLNGGGGVWAVGPYGGKGHDTITNCALDCYGGAGDDSLTGDADGNVLHGESGNDTLYGKQGRDVLNGGTGNDKLHGNRGADRLNGNEGNDTLWGDQDNDALYGNSGNDTLYGGAGTDTLSSGPGSNKLYQ